jgi:hypothetical protein
MPHSGPSSAGDTTHLCAIGTSALDENRGSGYGSTRGLLGASLGRTSPNGVPGPTRDDFAARVVSIGLIGVLPTAAGTEIKAPFR